MKHDEWFGKVVRAEGLIEYQDAAVVSRTLMKGPKGSVTLFAFERGQELSEHSVPHDAMVSVVDGVAEVTLSGSPHRVATGEMLLMPAGAPHAVKAPDRFKMVLTILRS